MFHSRTILALTLISLAWTSITARAATLNTTMSVGATYDLAGNTQSSSSFINDGTPHIYRIDIFGQVSGLATNESFGAELYNLTLSGSSLSRNTVSAPGADLQTPKPNYVANNPALVNIADGATLRRFPVTSPAAKTPILVRPLLTCKQYWRASTSPTWETR